MSIYETGRPGLMAQFRKSSLSEAVGNCVEVAIIQTVLVRDSKDPEGPILRFTFDEWTVFVAGVRGGEFDLN
jgi:hypothetical protein